MSLVKNSSALAAGFDVGSSSATELLAGRSNQMYRPAKLEVDLRRQTPLVQIYKGAPPAEVLEKACLPPHNLTGTVAVTAHIILLRLSGDRCRD